MCSSDLALFCDIISYLLEASTRKLVSKCSHPAMNPTLTVMKKMTKLTPPAYLPPSKDTVKNKRKVPMAMVPDLLET
jgi:hypothetical protein